MTEATLRDGGTRDIDAVMVVMERAFDPAFGEAWNRGQCLGILSLPDVWLSIAEHAGRVIGFALSRVAVDDAELLLLAVEPPTRGLGIGHALIEAAASSAGGRGAKRLLLEVREGNGALVLYHRAGFAEIGRRAGYYRGSYGGRYDAMTLARTIA